MITPPYRKHVTVGGARLLLPVAMRDPAPARIRASHYMRMIGMEGEDAELRLGEWLQRGLVDGVYYNGGVYMRRPSWRCPPPGYVPLIQWAAAQGVSKQWAHRLLMTGRLLPAWRFRVRHYHHALVASWATVGDAP